LKLAVVVAAVSVSAACGGTGGDAADPLPAQTTAAPARLSAADFCKRAMPHMVAATNEISIASKHPDGTKTDVTKLSGIVDDLAQDQKDAPAQYTDKVGTVRSVLDQWRLALVNRRNIVLDTARFQSAQIEILTECGNAVP
jgi:hypothetical protein